jgi:hypothetical protein
LRRLHQTAGYHDLKEALAQPGCAVCALKARAVDRFLDGLLWDQVTDPVTRQQVRAAQGFCPDHTWRLVRPQAALGIAILSRDVLHSVLQTLEGIQHRQLPAFSRRRVRESLDRTVSSAAAGEVVARLTPDKACPACVQADAMEVVYLDTLLDQLLGSDGLLSAFSASDGLCLPHLRKAAPRARDRAAFHALIEAQASIWTRLVGDLDEFTRKSDTRFRDEPWGEERDAWRRAVAALGGSRTGGE